MQEFKKRIKLTSVCVAKEDEVASNTEPKNYETVIKNLLKQENARVVVCFCEGMTIRNLLMAVKRLKKEGHFLFIGSDGWADRPDVVNDIEEVAVGGLSVKLYSPKLERFDQHYFGLNPFNNSRNPWFKEFWQERFHCYLDDEKERNFNYDKPCTGKRQSFYII